jgi:hypothetical protein
MMGKSFKFKDGDTITVAEFIKKIVQTGDLYYRCTVVGSRGERRDDINLTSHEISLNVVPA